MTAREDTESHHALAEHLRGVADKLDDGQYCNHDAWADLTYRSPYASDDVLDEEGVPKAVSPGRTGGDYR